MKVTRIIAICLAVCMLLTLPICASSTRASEQLNSYSVYPYRASGELNVSVSISGTLDVTKIGCEVIRVYEQVGSVWVLREYLREDDPNMSWDSRVYLYTHTFDANDNSEYRVDVIIFAEDPDGRDTRTFTHYV